MAQERIGSTTERKPQGSDKSGGKPAAAAPGHSAAAATPDGGPGSSSAGPAKPVAGSAARLGLAVGADRLLVDLSEAGEIVPLPSVILPVPLTRDWLLGVTNLRGSLYTVVDLRRFALGQFTEAGKEARVLALADGLEFNVTLVVSKMLGLRNTASMKPVEGSQLAGLPATSLIGCSTRDWLGKVHVDADGHHWRELSLARLAQDRDFLMIGRH